MYKFDKDLLLKESQDLNFEEVEINDLFESIEDQNTKAQLVEAFQLASRNGAVKLAEAHLAKIVERAEEMLQEEVQKVNEQFDKSLVEAVDSFLVAVAEDWLNENELAIENFVKANLFESLMGNLKTTFIEHNVAIPEEQIDILEELTLEEQEARQMANDLFAQNKALKEELMEIKRDGLIGSLAVGMTESQKEAFSDLAKVIKLDESYEDRIHRLAESFTNSSKEDTKISLTKSLVEGSEKQTEQQVDEQSLNEALNQSSDTETKTVKKTLTQEELLRRMV